MPDIVPTLVGSVPNQTEIFVDVSYSSGGLSKISALLQVCYVDAVICGENRQIRVKRMVVCDAISIGFRIMFCLLFSVAC